MSLTRQDAYDLLQRGAIALAQVEANGMRIDTEYVKKAEAKADRMIRRLQKKLETSEAGKLWQKKYRRKMNLTSDDQLADILFNAMGYKPKVFTDTGKPATSEEALESIDLPFVQDYLRMKKWMKAKGTYLKALSVEEVDGFIHPFFNLHLVRTYRSSSDSPNFQNIPVRNPEIKKLIRQACIPRDGRHLVEIDFSGAEVCVAACYHKDPTMLKYINDPTTDLHRDMAMECYMLTEDEVTKTIRYSGKNKFVFPQFYGDWYISCARALWEAIDQLELKTESGISLKEHLAGKGIKRLGRCDPKKEAPEDTFERHIQKVEKDFWGRRFKVYSSWKKKWFEKYQKNGFFDTLTGFRCSGFMKRNDVINYPVQGSAFHCLLWSLCELQDWLNRTKKKSLIIGQIHDSIVADVTHEELPVFIRQAKKIMTKKLPEAWPWIIVPIEVEIEVAPLNGSWYEKEEISI